VAPTLTLVTLATAAAGQALARALDATGHAVAAFTVGTLTASVAPGSTLTASTAVSGTAAYAATYGAAYGPLEATLTATTTRTGGPQ
jgi:hypothetical protein